jgi:hypothetical protein
MRHAAKLSIIAIGVLSASLGASVAFAGDADLTGTWHLAVQTGAGTGNPTLVLEQDGTELTGTYRGQLGESAVEGTVDDRGFSLTFNVSSPMGSLDVSYQGEVDGDEMSGSVSMGALGGGTFTGQRQ